MMETTKNLTSDDLRTFSITTAIDYPNGAPHGHSQEKIEEDVVACYHQLLSDVAAFCIGLDAIT